MRSHRAGWVARPGCPSRRAAPCAGAATASRTAHGHDDAGRHASARCTGESPPSPPPRSPFERRGWSRFIRWHLRSFEPSSTACTSITTAGLPDLGRRARIPGHRGVNGPPMIAHFLATAAASNQATARRCVETVKQQLAAAKSSRHRAGRRVPRRALSLDPAAAFTRLRSYARNHGQIRGPGRVRRTAGVAGRAAGWWPLPRGHLRRDRWCESPAAPGWPGPAPRRPREPKPQE
jgi:hypothetical protein